MAKIVVLGATSGIAMACAELWASQGHELFLVARHRNRLDQLKADLVLKNPKTMIHLMVEKLSSDQASEMSQLSKKIFDQAYETLKSVDRVFLCYGELGDESRLQQDYVDLVNLFQVNALSQISLSMEASKRLTKGAVLGVVTSVAGDRGRQSNFVYGASKAALITFLSGLRGRLFSRGVSVLDIRPGFVDTPMTSGFKKGILWSSPQRVSKIIDRGFMRQKSIVYAPSFWKWIMLVIKLIPESLFKRLRI